MKIMSVEELKANFSQAFKRVLAGEEIAIAYGKRKEIVARLVPGKNHKKSKRKLGIWDDRAKIKFHKDFKMTEEEFLNL